MTRFLKTCSRTRMAASVSRTAPAARGIFTASVGVHAADTFSVCVVEPGGIAGAPVLCLAYLTVRILVSESPTVNVSAGALGRGLALRLLLVAVGTVYAAAPIKTGTIPGCEFGATVKAGSVIPEGNSPGHLVYSLGLSPVGVGRRCPVCSITLLVAHSEAVSSPAAGGGAGVVGASLGHARPASRLEAGLPGWAQVRQVRHRGLPRLEQASQA